MVSEKTKQILERVDTLRGQYDAHSVTRSRIRGIVRGGQEAVEAMLGPDVKLPQGDLPAANLIASGVERLAQRLRHAPDVKVPVPTGSQFDSKRSKDRQDKKRRIVASYDQADNMNVQLAQVARWLPGYGFAVWVIRERVDPNGNKYPTAELRDPYDCYPGPWGVNQQPEDLAVVRTIPVEKARRMFPKVADKLTPSAKRILGQSRWEGSGDIEIVTYYDEQGSWVLLPDIEEAVSFTPNPLSTPQFVVPKRVSFDSLAGQFDHVIGLNAEMAKMNILAAIAAEDGVFRETNIIGDIETNEYRRGRFAVNYFAPGTQIEKPASDAPFQVFTQIDRLERQLRVGAAYSAISDAESPTSWVTGQGLDRLAGGGEDNVAEYQEVLSNALVAVDAKRLEWDDKMYGSRPKPLVGHADGVDYTDTYSPSADIDGDYRTRRVYGVMAGWDDANKIVTGLQLMQARVLDRETMQENLRGVDNASLINERIFRQDATDRLMDFLTQSALQGDPAARQALVEIRKNPHQTDSILDKFFTPNEPQVSPEEEQFLAAQQQQQQPQPSGPPPGVSTVLSRLMSDGTADGGVQTVGRL